MRDSLNFAVIFSNTRKVYLSNHLDRTAPKTKVACDAAMLMQYLEMIEVPSVPEQTKLFENTRSGSAETLNHPSGLAETQSAQQVRPSTSDDRGHDPMISEDHPLNVKAQNVVAASQIGTTGAQTLHPGVEVDYPMPGFHSPNGDQQTQEYLVHAHDATN